LEVYSRALNPDVRLTPDVDVRPREGLPTPF
jgi:hypothetical protein